ncbi:hypothetical protein [Paraflavitalea sp. CAU 1676]|uniref:hypothetical protein n=1 Tax=Paraflavitalea sp. CAU 1676 TaxID=3032598 RepID=UPI0023DBDD05|nr:hypothetical protein [Paraflavitalea sp. CAU 1676]MDF2190140.1 hypothetical protein [Paraflavitalea sp. CAU 1676]
MKSSKKINILKAICPLALGAMAMVGCQKDSNTDYEEYAPVDSLVATFSVTPVPGNDTKFVITNTTKGEFVGTRWDVGKGSGALMGKTSDTVFYPLAGTYAIKMQALDKRGKLYSAPSVNVTTTKNDPAYDNLIKGANMNAGDEQFWGKYDATGNKIVWTLANNAYTATTATKPVTAQVNGGMYQAVQVVANKTYRFTMNVSYGAPQDAWLELYFGQAVPADGKDYTDNKKLGLINWGTWTPFNGSRTVDMTFGASGTIYAVIKAGCNSANGHFSTEGISIKNVDFRRIQE